MHYVFHHFYYFLFAYGVKSDGLKLAIFKRGNVSDTRSQSWRNLCNTKKDCFWIAANTHFNDWGFLIFIARETQER